MGSGGRNDFFSFHNYSDAGAGEAGYGSVSDVL